MGAFQELSEVKHDMKCENQLLFNQVAMLYTLLAIAPNTGATGPLKDLLWIWVPIFLACGKHKYSTHLSKFLQDLCNTIMVRSLQGRSGYVWVEVTDILQRYSRAS